MIYHLRHMFQFVNHILQDHDLKSHRLLTDFCLKGNKPYKLLFARYHYLTNDALISQLLCPKYRPQVSYHFHQLPLFFHLDGRPQQLHHQCAIGRTFKYVFLDCKLLQHLLYSKLVNHLLKTLGCFWQSLLCIHGPTQVKVQQVVPCLHFLMDV